MLQLSGITELIHHLSLVHGETSSAICVIPVFLHTAFFCSFLSIAWMFIQPKPPFPKCTTCQQFSDSPLPSECLFDVEGPSLTQRNS